MARQIFIKINLLLSNLRNEVSSYWSKEIQDAIPTGQLWQQHKHSFMKDLLNAKARHCKEFREQLSATGNVMLVEGTTHKYWVSGLNLLQTKNTNPGEYPGRNELGRILMNILQKLSKSDIGNEHLQQ